MSVFATDVVGALGFGPFIAKDVDFQSPHADCLKGLEQKGGGEGSPRDLVIEVLRGLSGSEFLEPLGEIGVGEIAESHFRPKDTPRSAGLGIRIPGHVDDPQFLSVSTLEKGPIACNDLICEAPPSPARKSRMRQHFLKSSEARTIGLEEILTLSEAKARKRFCELRWPDTNGKPVCPHCGHEDKSYWLKRREVFKCAACRKTYSVTSGTIFHGCKLRLRKCLAAIFLFNNAAKGISASQLSRDLNISYKAAFVFLHKLRQAIAHTRGNLMVGGHVEIDGVYFGGYTRPPNTGREGRRAKVKRRQKCVLSLVSRDGGTIPVVVQSETTEDILSLARKHILPGSTVYADEHGAYDALHGLFPVRRINHRLAYADGEVSTNQAESFFSRFRRGQVGQYHRLSGQYLVRYAHEMAYRSDRRRVDNGTLLAEMTEMALAHPVSREWKGYWRRRPRPLPAAGQ